jgi:hypothetical protein
MLGDLTGIPEDALLDMVRLIVSKPGEISREDRANLYQVNAELAKRDHASRKARRKQVTELRKMRRAIERRVHNGGNE